MEEIEGDLTQIFEKEHNAPSSVVTVSPFSLRAFKCSPLARKITATSEIRDKWRRVSLHSTRPLLQFLQLLF